MPGPKILLIRFSSIGDIVLTTPVIRCLRQQLDAEVHFLCKTAYRSILDSNPYLSKVYGIKQSINEELPALRAEGYDYIIDLHKNLRSLHLQLALCKRAYSFDKLNWRKWLLVNWKVNRLPDLHIVDRYLKAVEPLGIVSDGEGLDYFIPKAEQLDVTTFLESKGGTAERYIAFAIGAAHATKRLPEAQLKAICGQLKTTVVLLGGEAERGVGEEVAAEGSHIVNACGELSLHQSAAIIQQAHAVITPDTGMMHIAAAFNKKIISVWGNTVPVLGMYPYYGKAPSLNQSFEVDNLSCRPCSKIGHSQCPKGHFRCMKEQDTKAIAKAAQA